MGNRYGLVGDTGPQDGVLTAEFFKADKYTSAEVRTSNESPPSPSPIRLYAVRHTIVIKIPGFKNYILREWHCRSSGMI